MAYFVTTLVTIFLCILEISFLPHFKIFDIAPLVTLAFISALAVRYRGMFHIFLAFAVGIFFASLTSTYAWFFPFIFLLTVLIGKFVFYRETGYNATQSFFTLFLTSSTFLYLLIFAQIMVRSQVKWTSVVTVLLAAFIVNIFAGYVVYKVFDKLFDWLNKMAEERYR